VTPPDAPDVATLPVPGPSAAPAASRTSKAILLAFSQVLNMGLGLVLSSGLAWMLPDRSVYGSFQQLLLIYSVLAGPMAVGLPDAVYYFLPRLDPARRKAFLVAAHLALLTTGAVVSAILFFGADLIAARFGSEHLAPLLRVFFPLPLFLLPQMILDPTLVCQSRLFTMTILQATSRAMTAAAVLIPVFLGADLGAGVFAWVLAGAVAETVAVFVIFRPLRDVRPSWRPGMGREIVRFTAPIVGATLLAPLALMGDKLLVSALFGAATYAIYVNGTYAVSLAYTFLLRAMAVLIADFSGMIHAGRWDDLVALWGRASFKAALVLFGIAGAISGGADEVVRVLFSERYLESVDVMRIAILGVLPRVLFCSSILQAMGRTGWYASITVVAVFTGPLSVILFGYVLDMGPVGAALGYVVGEYLHSAWQVGLVKYVIRQSPMRVYPVGRLVALAVWALATGYGSFFLVRTLMPEPLPAILRLATGGLLFAALYGLGILRFGIARFDTEVAPMMRLVRLNPDRVPAWLRR
jgi:O-antigen/teichoic acid export membrane protein